MCDKKMNSKCRASLSKIRKKSFSYEKKLQNIKDAELKQKKNV